MSDIKEITDVLKKFRDDRDWAQFHNPKDLAVAISIEAGELLEQYLWKLPEEAIVDKVKEELADVMAYSFLLAEKYDLDVRQLIMEKINKNEVKYPINKSKVTAKKYTDL